MDEREFEELLAKYEGLFRSVLSKCHVYQDSFPYEDYLQRLRIQFFELSIPHASIRAFELAFPVGYLFQRLSWEIINLQRVEKRQVEVFRRMTLYYRESVSCTPQNKVEVLNLFESVYRRATPTEKEFLQSLLKETRVSYLAKHYKVTPQTIRNKKRELFLKYFN
ncbi:hypothetical protein BAU15_13795 [Enterococcus sp. JM4C]|uniref:hypothetical protein n=1 Tax=Candidatus Enterococcus huntleyi TaxID=1857217 RepID=UPI00137B718C|nr:hypothetical protein [Enterococcus sp. JM4C]KAF1298345.1 hypothetical protein BAU15_13795 [Enterococcus sp. JM4C]